MSAVGKESVANSHTHLLHRKMQRKPSGENRRAFSFLDSNRNVATGVSLDVAMAKPRGWTNLQSSQFEAGRKIQTDTFANQATEHCKSVTGGAAAAHG